MAELLTYRLTLEARKGIERSFESDLRGVRGFDARSGGEDEFSFTVPMKVGF